MRLRSRFNNLLSKTTGYQLVRGDAVPTVRAQQAKSVAEELAVATKTAQAAQTELEKTVAAAKSDNPAAGQATPQKPAKSKPRYPDDFDPETVEVIDQVRPYTMTSPDKLHALIAATRYVHAHNVPGDVLECGVWRGGSMHAVARTLDSRGDHSRDLFLFDTYEGMPPPSDRDVRADGSRAADLLAKTSKSSKVWAVATLDDVRTGFEENIKYPAAEIH